MSSLGDRLLALVRPDGGDRPVPIGEDLQPDDLAGPELEHVGTLRLIRAAAAIPG